MYTPQQYAQASIKTADNLRTVAHSMVVLKVSSLSLLEVDAAVPQPQSPPSPTNAQELLQEFEKYQPLVLVCKGVECHIWTCQVQYHHIWKAALCECVNIGFES